MVGRRLAAGAKVSYHMGKELVIHGKRKPHFYLHSGNKSFILQGAGGCEDTKQAFDFQLHGESGN